MHDYSDTPSGNKREEEKRRKEKSQGLFLEFYLGYYLYLYTVQINCLQLTGFDHSSLTFDNANSEQKRNKKEKNNK